MSLLRSLLSTVVCLLGLVASAAALCPANPVANCQLAERSALTLRNDPVDSKDRLIWKWGKGEPTAPTQFDDPTAATVYNWCVYSTVAQTLRTGGEAVIPGSAVLWQPTKKGYKYKDKSLQHDGISTAVLRADPLPSRSSALVKGKGANLPDPPLGLVSADFPLTVQLINGDTNFCLESTFLEVDIRRNDSTQLKIKNQ